jgi:hypothetical protein
MRAPIAIMSFNRPDYLAQTLASLKAQTPGALDGREVHLFQDGAVNLYSGIAYAKRGDIDAAMAVFLEHFPEGQVHFWDHNIGICENFYRAEAYLLHERGFEFAYFFEDDLVLSPVYLDMMELLQRYAERMPQVAYFSAYGDHYAQPEEIAERGREMTNLDHHWAFGLRSSAWAQIRDYLAPYYGIVRGHDYARRDHQAVFDLFATVGAVPRGSSQDAAKAWACDQLGLWRCRSFAPFARYIGSTGAHMTPEEFERLGFAKTTIQEQMIADLDFPDAAGVETRLAQQHALFVGVFRNELDELRKHLPARKLNPMRPCTADDVKYVYRLLLHREPESQDIVDYHVKTTTVYRLAQDVILSQEFIRLKDNIPA